MFHSHSEHHMSHRCWDLRKISERRVDPHKRHHMLLPEHNSRYHVHIQHKHLWIHSLFSLLSTSGRENKNTVPSTQLAFKAVQSKLFTQIPFSSQYAPHVVSLLGSPQAATSAELCSVHVKGPDGASGTGSGGGGGGGVGVGVSSTINDTFPSTRSGKLGPPVWVVTSTGCCG